MDYASGEARKLRRRTQGQVPLTRPARTSAAIDEAQAQAAPPFPFAGGDPATAQASARSFHRDREVEPIFRADQWAGVVRVLSDENGAVSKDRV